ncbi:MAG: glycosyltransferase family 1 protein [Sediminibacterium sp.]|nr:glycosyltransferase family 1 protein [Sediminibacterium sp.]
MKIAVNTRLLLANRLEGIGWFSFQTLKRITKDHPDVHFIYLFDRDFDESFITSNNITPLIIGPQARHPFLYYAWFQWSVKQTLNRLKPDLFLSPDGFLSLGAKTRQLPVIHDINFHHFPQDVSRLSARYYNYFFPKYARAATRIATVSEYSKQDIAKTYGVNPAKIDVVYNGINEFFQPLDTNSKNAVKQKWTQGQDYFVYVGSLHPRKNIPNLIRGFNAFKRNGSPIKLVLAGPLFWGKEEIDAALNASIYKNDVIFTGRLNNEELNAVLASALAMTMVPRYEGFGIPVVEAMQAGVPVIYSNVSSLPEVAGDAGIAVNQNDPSDIARAMLQMAGDETLRRTCIEKGLVQKQKFSWDKSAHLLWKSIEKCVHP